MIRLLFIIIGFHFFLANAQFSQNDFSLPKPDSLQNLKKLDFWATYYYIYQLKSSGSIPFRDEHGKSMGLFGDTCDFCHAALEGTASITDSAGKVYIVNFEKAGDVSVADCRACRKFSGSALSVENWGKVLWKISSGYGRGIRDYRLQPYRTIAVDPAMIPYGSVVYVPALDGVLITQPDGRVIKHDGYLFAGDAGSAIKGNHIDVFTGVLSYNPFPDLVFSDPRKTFTAYIVTDKNIINMLLNLHIGVK